MRMAFFNQYSLALAVGIVGLTLAFFMWRWRGGPRWLRLALVGLYAVAAFGILALVRYPEPRYPSVASVQEALHNGQPTLVMLYSNY
jgi:hypothetical protein